MNSEKENSSNMGSQSGSAYKINQQTKTASEQTYPETRPERTKRESEIDQPKFGRPGQPERETDHRRARDMDDARMPSEFEDDAKEFTKNDQRSYTDRTEQI